VSCVQTARARTGEALAGAPLDDGKIHAKDYPFEERNRRLDLILAGR
jgi:hypothetical protein